MDRDVGSTANPLGQSERHSPVDRVDHHAVNHSGVCVVYGGQQTQHVAVGNIRIIKNTQRQQINDDFVSPFQHNPVGDRIGDKR